MRLRSILIAGLLLSVILTACAPATLAPTTVPPTSQLTLPPATLARTLEPIGVGIPAIEYIKGQSELVVISSITGKPFGEFDTIPLESYNSYAFSPDGKTLAVVSRAQLYLIDLPTWKYRTIDINLHGPINAAVYSPDGSLLALAGGAPAWDLRVVDARSGAVKASAQTDFSVSNIKFTADRKALMVYGPHLVAEISTGAPKAALLALSDLSVLWSVKLKGIRHGIFPKKPGTLDIYQPGAAWHYEPGIAFAPNNDILYIVHGDEDKLTTVDFTDRKVKTVDVRVRTTWLDRLLSLTAGVAYAKGMDGTAKQAVISPDGKLLFVAGNTETVTQQANGNNWDIKDTPTGLQVISTEDGTLIDQTNTEASSVRLSFENTQLFLDGWKNGTSWTDVYDISSKSVVKHFEDVYLVSTRRLDGKPILASNHSVGPYESYITLIDPNTWATISEWKSEGDLGWLSVP